MCRISVYYLKKHSFFVTVTESSTNPPVVPPTVPTSHPPTINY